MRLSMECPVNAAIERGLSGARDVCAAKELRVETDLQATERWGADDAVLQLAIVTIFRGWPDRLAPRSTFRVWTRDMAGGDIELGWEGRDDAEVLQEDSVAAHLAGGLHGDLLGLAVRGLEEICRARTAAREGVARRFTFLLPSESNRLNRA